MADEKVVEVPMELELQLALKEFDWSLDALQVQPLGDEMFGRAPTAESEVGDTSSGFTCNSKCGDTGYWQCPPWSSGGTACSATCDGTCSGVCTTDSYCNTDNATSPCCCFGSGG